MKYIFIIIGGGLGAVLRYVSIQIAQIFCPLSFPAGTFLVNALGSFAIGFLYNTFEAVLVPAGLRLFLITGFLGAYTTFSTYSFETVQFVRQGNIKQALFNICLHNLTGILLVLAGIRLSAVLIKEP